MVAATMHVYKAATRSFLPMPSKSHYVFNLRDFARVVRGVLLVPAARMAADTDKIVRLWVHEVYRVFNDRLTDDHDRSDNSRSPSLTYYCGVTCQSRRGPGQRGDWQMANDRRAAASEAGLKLATCMQS